jgi:isoleucyl-tRNA synthetase
MPDELKDTLNLPVTPFPMRANLTEREPARITYWEKTKLYERLQSQPAPKGAFVLHDGPPFTNGDVHIGTALNKLLKDIILRYKTMRGFRAPYVPGWDCHGLPIEHKVVKEMREAQTHKNPNAGKTPEGTSAIAAADPLEIRRACARFSASYIERQRKQFRRLGVLADWAAEYKTMDPAYEADILRTFASFVSNGLVYRRKKPVYWSIPCATALAEAEIEYKDKTSPSIWVAFPVPASEAAKIGVTDQPLSIVIWTTTPWTLPANLAIAVHPDIEYTEVRCNGKSYLAATVLADAFAEACALNNATRGVSLQGSALQGLRARHPFIDRDSPVVTAEYVTTDAGTGCVHTAPGHGLDDYITGNKYGLEIYCPVNDAGAYDDDGRVPAALVGVSILETNGESPANTAVLRLLREHGALLELRPIQHQYPHCWRSKTPVIFRAMDQWFVALDHDARRQQALDAISSVSWNPAWGENRIRAAIENRPDWCISRQRSWGVPIPAFQDSSRRILLDANVIRAIADKVAVAGSDLWFAQSAAEILAGIPLPPAWPDPATLTKTTDTLDVWLDSGTSHLAVLTRNPDLHWPADIYLEGSDQHRGWFQSSLWTAIITKNAPPYRRVITHGFVVNEKRQKISKSDGKPQTADGYVNKHGADIVRLWIASENYQSDIPLSDTIFDAVSTQYRGIRNTLRYQLGNIYDFDPARDAVPLPALTLPDKWALHKLHALVSEVTAACENYEFHKATAALAAFSATTLSATYHNILKDRLYTLAPNAPTRRAAQTVIHITFKTLIRLLAPFIPFTADEAWCVFSTAAEYPDSTTPPCAHLLDWSDAPAEWRNDGAANEFDTLLNVLNQINCGLESLRKTKTIGQSLDARAIISADPADPVFTLLRKYEPALAEIFIVSQVELSPLPPDSPLRVETTTAVGERCPRCWRWSPVFDDSETYGKVCPRCRDALASLSKN